jgi:2,3-bisphosphoglycerate-dependent phosphoglycerate mutase
LLWRRSYDVMPPLLSEEEAAKQAKDPRYKHLQVKDLPQGETLKTTLDRVLPIWQDKIAVDLLDGKNVLVVAHGNSLRSLVKYLLNLSEDEILKFEIPTGTPLVFDLDENLQVKEYHFEK